MSIDVSEHRVNNKSHVVVQEKQAARKTKIHKKEGNGGKRTVKHAPSEMGQKFCKCNVTGGADCRRFNSPTLAFDIQILFAKKNSSSSIKSIKITS